MENIFERTTRLKLRFDTAKGKLSVEDLWELPLEKGVVNLNIIAVALSNELGESGINFVRDVEDDPIIALKFDVVKYIIRARVIELKEIVKEAERKDERNKIIDALGAKEIDELKGKSAKELRKALKKLG